MLANTRALVVTGPDRISCRTGAPAYSTWWEILLLDGSRGWVSEDGLRVGAEPLRLVQATRAGDRLRLMWPLGAADLQLEQSFQLPPTNWVPVIVERMTNGQQLVIDLSFGERAAIHASA